MIQKPKMKSFSTKLLISHTYVFLIAECIFTIYENNKFENNSKPRTFLSYITDSTGYRILDLSLNSMILTRDVYFWKIFLELLILPSFQKYI